MNVQTGQLYFKTGDGYGEWSQPVRIKGDRGENGSVRFSTLTGDEKLQLKGDRGTVTVGNIEILPPDAGGYVSNVGTDTDGILNFGIPRGVQGERGYHYKPSVDSGGLLLWTVEDGDPGMVEPASIVGPRGVSIDHISNAPSSENGGANVVTVYFDNGDSASFEVLNGEKGDVGTVGIGTVTLTDDTENAVVSAVGTASGVNLDFTIPRGLQGVRGTKWFSGTGLSGTGTNLSISVADDNDYIIGDMYFNRDSSSIYECVLGGRYDEALWDYKCNNKGNDFEIDGVGLFASKPSNASLGYTYYVRDAGEPDYDGKLIVKVGSGVNDWSEPIDFKGEKGDTGAKGNTGEISIGTVSVVDDVESATVTNVGTSTSAVLNFNIPKGEKGDTGNVMYATFDIDSAGHLIMTSDDGYTGPQFRLSNGRLEVVL